MDWKPLSKVSLRDLLGEAEQRMSADVRRLWDALRIAPEKWAQHPYGDEGGGFWVVAVFGSRVIWYNDIEEGFNVSRYGSAGEIAEYLCEQEELENVLQRLLSFLQTGQPPFGVEG